MKLLLTSSGITNQSIHDALVALLGQPIAESNALFIPTAIYPFQGGGQMARRAICGQTRSPLCQIGWKSLGVLELTALTSVDRDAWVPAVEQTDALLVWGGDPLYLSYWLRQSGLADLLHALRRDLVYVGVSAGSMATSFTFGETYMAPPNTKTDPFESEQMSFETAQGNVDRTFVIAQGAGFVDFALIAHLDHSDHPDASTSNAKKWASKLPVPVYAIDDESAIQVVDGTVEVISEGHWQLFTPEAI